MVGPLGIDNVDIEYNVHAVRVVPRAMPLHKLARRFRFEIECCEFKSRQRAEGLLWIDIVRAPHSLFGFEESGEV